MFNVGENTILKALYPGVPKAERNRILFFFFFLGKEREKEGQTENLKEAPPHPAWSPMRGPISPP